MTVPSICKYLRKQILNTANRGPTQEEMQAAKHSAISHIKSLPEDQQVYAKARWQADARNLTSPQVLKQAARTRAWGRPQGGPAIL